MNPPLSVTSAPTRSHVRDSGELVLDALYLRPGHGGAGKRTQEDAAHGVAKGHTEPYVEGFGRESSVRPR